MSYLNADSFRSELRTLFLTGDATRLVAHLAEQVFEDFEEAGFAPSTLETTMPNSGLLESLVCQSELFREEPDAPRWRFQAYCWAMPISLKGGHVDCLSFDVGIRILGRGYPVGNKVLAETVLLHKKLTTEGVSPSALLDSVANALSVGWRNKDSFNLDGRWMVGELTEHLAP